MTHVQSLHDSTYSFRQCSPPPKPNMDEILREEVKKGDLENLHVVLFSSSTSSRVRTLQELRDTANSTSYKKVISGRKNVKRPFCLLILTLLPVSELPQNARHALLELLLKTYSLYVDRPSRHTAQECLRSLIGTPVSTEDLKFLTQKLQREASKPGLAAASAFVLLEWCSVLLLILRNDSTTPLPDVLDILVVDAKALERCLAAKPKPAVEQSALRVTRRALRAAFAPETRGGDSVRQSVDRLTSGPAAGVENIPFLGIISGVCARLPARKPILEEVKKSIFSFYAKEVIGSRTVVPAHIANGLFDFFVSFTTYEDVVTELIPSLEKAFLRSPEAVFSGVTPALCRALPKELDLSEVLYSHLLKHLLSSMKSHNALIRQGAAKSFEALLSRCKSDNWLLKIASETISPLKTQKITNADHRAVYAQVLAGIPASKDLSSEVIQSFVPVFARESNEIALEQEIRAFCKHLAYAIELRISIPSDAVSTIVKGSAEKRVSFRNLWQLNVGNVLWNASSDVLAAPEAEVLVDQFTNKMKDLFKEVASNPLPSAQNGVLSTAYIFVALFDKFSSHQNQEKTAWDDIVSQSMTLTPKPSFLLNPRVYSKLASQEEVKWAARAIAAVVSSVKFEGAEDAAKDAWAQAFIFTITGPGLRTDAREESVHALSNVVLKNGEGTGRVVIGALWSWILSSKTAEKESAAHSAGPESGYHLHLVIRALGLAISGLRGAGEHASGLSVSHHLLVELLVLCRPELITNASWIALCLRTGVDPGNLVRELPNECMKQLIRVNEVSQPPTLPERLT